MIALIAAALLLQDTKGETYHVGHGPKFVNITFESHADFETIVGTSMTAKGTVIVDHAGETGSVDLTVPVASLRTGIPLRDEHLRSPNWLDEAKYPDIRFVSKKVEKVKDAKNRFAVTGDFTLHGVTREMTIEVEWRELPADTARKARFPEGKWLRFSGEFKAKLSDHGVKLPDGSIGKVEDTWTVRLAIFASTAPIEQKK